MIRTLIAALTALALAACVSAPAPTPVSAKGGLRVTGTATATLWGPWETEITLAKSRLDAVARDAARQLRAGRIDAATAATVHATLTRAEAALESARRGSLTAPGGPQLAAMTEARRLTTLADNLLEH